MMYRVQRMAPKKGKKKGGKVAEQKRKERAAKRLEKEGKEAEEKGEEKEELPQKKIPLTRSELKKRKNVTQNLRKEFGQNWQEGVCSFFYSCMIIYSLV